MNPYSYTPCEPRFNLKLEKSNGRWQQYAVDFPVARPTFYPEHNTALGHYYEPLDGENLPLAILVHGWGDRSDLPCRLLANDLLKRGFACFILYLVFHSSRMAAAVKSRSPNLTPEDWFEGYQTSVIDIRQIVDWAQVNPRIDKQQIAVIGISLGGIISAISMGVDNRIASGVFIVGGGNYENPEWLKKSGIHRTEAENIAARNLFESYLADVEKRGFENVDPPRKSYLTDPVTFGRYLRNRHILMLNATMDERIPRQTALGLWTAAGKPPIKWLPGTHSSIWLLYPLIRSKIIKFLDM